MSATLLGRAAPCDERAARADLRAQIAVLERRLAASPVADCGVRSRGPSLPSLGELERLRDVLVARDAACAAARAAEALRQRDARAQLEAMCADPRRHRRTAVALADLGLPGCGVYRARPRLGILGRLAGWWEVKLSSGCP